MVHMYGGVLILRNYDIAKKYNLPVVEDCAQGEER